MWRGQILWFSRKVQFKLEFALFEFTDVEGPLSESAFKINILIIYRFILQIEVY